MRSGARIVNGVWRRNVHWGKEGVWRTDFFRTVLADDHLMVADSTGSLSGFPSLSYVACFLLGTITAPNTAFGERSTSTRVAERLTGIRWS